MILTLTRVWLNRLDTGESLSAASGVDSGAPTYTDDGEVRKYASGRRRAVTIEGEGGEIGFTLLELSWTQVETLRAWKGKNIQVRDHRGQKLFGVFFTVAVKPQRGTVTICEASFVLQTTTTAEGV